MSRPTSKADLIGAADEQFSKLLNIIGRMDEEARNATFDLGGDPGRTEAHWDRDKNLRDILVHLYEWHQMVKRWYTEGTVKGGMPAVPGEGYTWRTLPELNQRIWERYQSTSLTDSETMLRGSHEMIMDLIRSHTNDELFSKGVYKWTKSTTLGAYFVSCTASHYEWAMNKIKVHIRTYKK
jgi:hypothetical protein